MMISAPNSLIIFPDGAERLVLPPITIGEHYSGAERPFSPPITMGERHSGAG